MKKQSHGAPKGPPSDINPTRLALCILAVGLALWLSVFLLDGAVRSVVLTYQTPLLLTAMQWMTRMGSLITLLSLSLLLVGTGYILKDKFLRHCGLLTLLTLFLSAMVSEGLKYLIGRPRPFLSEMGMDRWGPTGLAGFDSFPSGHATAIFAFAYILSYFFPRTKVPIFSLAVVVAFSRLYLDVHFFSDVIAGALLGTGIAMLLLQRTRFMMPIVPMRRPVEKPVDREVQ